jgi:hypothetical protein
LRNSFCCRILLLFLLLLLATHSQNSKNFSLDCPPNIFRVRV